MAQIIISRDELKERVNDGVHLVEVLPAKEFAGRICRERSTSRWQSLAKRPSRAWIRKTPQSFIAMTTSETWLPEPRRGSRVLASKRSFTTNREKPTGWRMDCRRSERIDRRNLSGSRTTSRSNCRHAGSMSLLGRPACERRNAATLSARW